MKRLLPLGSIVCLKDNLSEKNLIIGRLVRKEEYGEVYDYVGLKAPEGLQEHQELSFYNQDDIKKIIFIGLQDEDELNYCYYLGQISETLLKSV